MTDAHSNRDDLLGALDEIRAETAYFRGRGREDFVAPRVESRILRLAACHLIIVLQAVVDDLPAELISAADDLPFREVRGMRNRLAHGYSDIDDELLWNTLDGALPEFVDALRSRLDRFS